MSGDTLMSLAQIAAAVHRCMLGAARWTQKDPDSHSSKVTTLAEVSTSPKSAGQEVPGEALIGQAGSGDHSCD